MPQDDTVPAAGEVPEPDATEAQSPSKPDAPAVETQSGDESPEAEAKGKNRDETPEPIKRQLGELRRGIRAAERRAQAAEEERSRLLSLVESGAAPKATGDDDPQPDRDKFEDYEAFIRADAAWQTRQEFRKLDGERIAREQATRAQREANTALEDWSEREATFETAHDDYHDVVYAPGLNITTAMAAAIRATEAGPEVAYHLGKHPDEADRIARLSAAKATIQIGRLDERLSKERERSLAPDPVKPVRSGSGGAPNAMSDKASTREWMKARQKKVDGERRPL